MIDASGWSYFSNDPLWGVSNIHRLTGYDLGYSFDKAGNLLQIAGPITVNYTYDALNRLATLSESDTGTTSYTYDNVGNLQSVTYPNGVVHAYSYDARNRLANLGVNGTVNGAPGPIASYAYTLDASGHRTAVTELSGRTVNYGYDNLYRLTNETIAGDTHSMNGAVSYAYDAVGNRTQKTSALAGYPGGLSNYNANDQLTTDTYDANGNTTASIGLGYTYDFENHLIQAGGITYTYDGDGNRVKKITGGVTTQYTVDSRNPTGYAQVLMEWRSDVGAKYYEYGLELLNQWKYVGGPPPVSWYVHDGHGSVRALTDATGAVTDTYDYDAFGNLLNSSTTQCLNTSTGATSTVALGAACPAGSSPAPTYNNYLFSGEQFDPDLGLYYNRARYLNTSTGRFWTMDTYEGKLGEPLTLHRYLYAALDPVNRNDPSGLDGDLISFNISNAGNQTVDTMLTVSRMAVNFLLPRALTLAAFFGAGIFASNSNLPEEIEEGGPAAITAIQQNFLGLEQTISEAQAEEGSIWTSHGALKDYFNELFTGSRALNPPDIEYHHLVEQVQEEVSGFSVNAINSTANVIPTPSGVHQIISNFYGSAQTWLPEGETVRDWMGSQTWETQWEAGLAIWKQAMQSGAITWKP